MGHLSLESVMLRFYERRGGGKAFFGEKLALLPVPQVNVNKSPNFLF